MTSTSIYHLAQEKNTKLSKQVVNSKYIKLKKKFLNFLEVTSNEAFVVVIYI